MKRNNGFIDLNDYYHKIKQNNRWHNYDFLMEGIIRPNLYNDDHYWLKIKGKSYYFKPTNYPYHEVLTYFIAMYLGFDVTYYDLAELKNLEGKTLKGVISENFHKKDAKYISGADLLKEYFENCPEDVTDMGLTNDWQNFYNGPQYIPMNNLEIIWQALEFRYKNKPNVNIKVLMDDILKQYELAILTRAYDKGAQNWEIEESNNGVKICPGFDNEITFYNEHTTVSFSTGFKDSEKSIKDSIKRFLSISSSEYVEHFISCFNVLELDDIKRIISGVEHHIDSEIPLDVKNEILDNYKLNLQEINEALEELNLINNGR